MDLSIFNENNEEIINQECNNDFKNCLNVKKILSILYYYSSLNVNSNKNDQKLFNSLINTRYKIGDIIMDFFHFKQNHNLELVDIMQFAFDYYKFEFCDISICPYSSRLYRVNQLNSMLNIFDYDDKESSLGVVIGLLDSIHHYIFHLSDCGLRDFVDKEKKKKKKKKRSISYQ